MSDLTENLRLAATLPCDPRHRQTLVQAADRIEALEEVMAAVTTWMRTAEIAKGGPISHRIAAHVPYALTTLINTRLSDDGRGEDK